MEVVHVTHRAEREGTIDDVFRRLIERGSTEKEATLVLLESIRKNIEGPTAWACEGHHQLFLYACDKDHREYAPDQPDDPRVQVVAGTGFSITYDLPLAESPVPWSPRFCCQPLNIVQATIAVAHALRVVFQIHSGESESHQYINVNPEIATGASPDDRVKCPHCSVGFSLHDDSQWNGEIHLLCNQRLVVKRRTG